MAGLGGGHGYPGAGGAGHHLGAIHPMGGHGLGMMTGGHHSGNENL